MKNLNIFVENIMKMEHLKEYTSKKLGKDENKIIIASLGKLNKTKDGYVSNCSTVKSLILIKKVILILNLKRRHMSFQT